MKTIFDLWYDGNIVRKIAPYYCLRGFDLFKDGDSLVLSRATFVMSSIYEEAKVQGKVTRKNDMTSMTKVERDQLFEAAFISLGKIAKKTDDDVLLDKHRIGEMGFLRFYDLLKEPHRKKRKVA